MHINFPDIPGSASMSTTFPPPTCDSHELNLSATESAFTVVPYFCPKEDTEKADVLTVSSYCSW